LPHQSPHVFAPHAALGSISPHDSGAEITAPPGAAPLRSQFKNTPVWNRLNCFASEGGAAGGGGIAAHPDSFALDPVLFLGSGEQ